MITDMLKPYSFRSGYKQTKMVKEEVPPSKQHFSFSLLDWWTVCMLCRRLHHTSSRWRWVKLLFPEWWFHVCKSMCLQHFLTLFGPMRKSQRGKIGCTSLRKYHRVSVYRYLVWLHQSLDHHFLTFLSCFSSLQLFGILLEHNFLKVPPQHFNWAEV